MYLPLYGNDFVIYTGRNYFSALFSICCVHYMLSVYMPKKSFIPKKKTFWAIYGIKILGNVLEMHWVQSFFLIFRRS